MNEPNKRLYDIIDLKIKKIEKLESKLKEIQVFVDYIEKDGGETILTTSLKTILNDEL